MVSLDFDEEEKDEGVFSSIRSVLSLDFDDDIPASREFELSKRPQREKAAVKAEKSIGKQSEKFLDFGGDPDQLEQIFREDFSDPDKSSSFGIRFFELLDKVNFLQYGLFGGAKALSEGKGMDVVLTEMMKGFANILPQEALDQILGTDIEGSVTQTTFSDVLKSGGVGELGTTSIFAPILGDVTGRGAIGLVGDIIFDPLNLLTLGAGAVSKVGKVGKEAKELRYYAGASDRGTDALRSRLIARAEKALGYKVDDINKQLNLRKDPRTKNLIKEEDVVRPLFKFDGMSIEYHGQSAGDVILEIAERKAASEHGLIGFKIPFAKTFGIEDSGKIVLQGQPLLALADVLGKTERGNKILKGGRKVKDVVRKQLRQLFSTKTEDEAFNSLFIFFRNLRNHGIGKGATNEAAEIGKVIEEYGLKNHDFNSMIDFLQIDLPKGIDDLKAEKFKETAQQFLDDVGDDIVHPKTGKVPTLDEFLESNEFAPERYKLGAGRDSEGKVTASLRRRSVLDEKLDIIDNAKGVSEGKKEAMKSMVRSYHKMAENEMKAGILSSTLEVYFPHMLKPQIAKKLTEDRAFSVGIKGNTAGVQIDPNFAHRRTQLTIQEFNETMHQKFREQGMEVPTGGEVLLDDFSVEIKGPDGKDITMLAETDPRILVQMRASASAEALNTDAFLKKLTDERINGSFAKRFQRFESTVTKDADGNLMKPKEFAIPKGYKPVKIKEGESTRDILEGWVFENEIADHITKYLDVTGDTGAMNEFHRGYRKMFEFWKAWTLGIYPAYHVRNEIGNLWNNFLADVTPRSQVIGDKRYKLGVYGAAADIWKQKDGFININGQDVDFETIRRWLDEDGVVGSGLFGVEHPECFYDDIDKISGQPLAFGKGGKMSQRLVDTILKPFGRQKSAGDISALGVKLNESPAKNLLLGLGFMVGQGIENNARIAHYIQKLMDGKTRIAASQSVAAHLFDYTDLTKFERGVKQNLIPFYTFRRKNIPLQIASLMATPAKFTMLRKFKSGFENEDDVPASSSLSEFLRENVPIRIKKGKDGRHEYFLLNNWLPAADIEALFGIPSKSNLTPFRIQEEAFKMIFPGLSRVGELAFNFETFRGRQIQDFPGQRQTFLGQESVLGVPFSRPFVRVLESFRLLSEVDRFMKADLTLGQSLLRTATGARRFPFDEEREKLNRIFQTSADIRKLAQQQEREQTIDQIKLSRRGIQQW